MKKFAWSYSALAGYETCPKQFYHLRVAKDVIQKPNEHLSYGKEVHKALELRIKENKPLPLGLKHLEEIANRLNKAKGEKFTELRLAINRNYEPVDFFADDVYCRSVIDLAIIDGEKGWVIDYKTGRIKDDFEQLRLATAVLFCHMSKIKSVRSAYLWTKEKCLTKTHILREELVSIWNDFSPRVNKFEKAYNEVSFPARTNYLCKKHCPVKKCPHNGV